MCECICQSNSEYHAMLYLKHILRNLCVFVQLHKCQVSEGREHKTHVSVIHHMLSCHTASILNTGSKRLLSQRPSVSPCVRCTWVEKERSANQRGMGIENWVRGSRAVQKHRESLRPQLSQLHDL